MASEAEVDLIISTADALPQLERDLEAIVRRAEADADAVELQALLDADDSLAQLISDMDAVIRDAELAADPIELEARLDQSQALEDLRDDLNEVIFAAEQAAHEIELDAALDADIASLDAELQALVAELEASAPDIEIEVQIDRDGRGAGGADRLGKILKGLPGPLAAVSKGFAGLSGAASVAPVLAGATAALQQLGPAAAVAVPALISLQLATQTVKIGMIGVGDAVKGAFDPDTKPEDLAKAMEKLAPSARAFVTELQGMRGQLKEIQQSVQNNLFEGLDGALKVLGQRALPIVEEQLQLTAGALNEMAHGAAGAALELANNGTLGQALGGATDGLFNLAKVPGQVITALGQLGAAAAPAFDRVTTGAANAATAISEKLSKAFQSGELENAINIAIDSFVQLGRIVGNVFEGLGNIFETFTATGDGVFGTMEKVTQAFADVTATQGFKDALTALSAVMSTVVTTVLPLVSTALQALGPVFQALGPPIQLLVMALGNALTPIIKALGPVLVSLSQAFGQLVGFVTPLLGLASKLITAILPALSPLFDAVGQTINAMLPFVQQLTDTFAAALVPVITTLATTVLPQLLPPLVQLSTAIFPILTKIITEMSPTIVRLAETFAQLLVALTPLIVELLNLTLTLLDKLMPVIQPIIDLMIKLTTGALGLLVAQITGLVIPALNILVQLLKGDFSGAFQGAKDLVQNVWAKVVEITNQMTNNVAGKLRELVAQIGARVGEIRDRAVQGFQDMVNRAAAEVGKLPGRLLSALGDLGNLLFSAGADVVRGFIGGLTSQLGRLRDIASDIGDTVRGAVGKILDIHSPSRVMRTMGQDTVEGFKLGIQDGLGSLESQLTRIGQRVPGLSTAGIGLAPQAGGGVPTVQVFLGNELIDAHVDARIARSNQARDLIASRGVRR